MLIETRTANIHGSASAVCIGTSKIGYLLEFVISFPKMIYLFIERKYLFFHTDIPFNQKDHCAISALLTMATKFWIHKYYPSSLICTYGHSQQYIDWGLADQVILCIIIYVH